MPVRARWVLGLVLLLAMTVPGCAAPRDLPERADPETLKSLDVCALVPLAEVKQRNPEMKFAYGARLVIEPDSCWFAVAPAERVWLAPVSGRLPKAVSEQDVEGVSEHRVPGGMVLTAEVDRAPFCRHYAIADRGIWLEVKVGLVTSKPAICALAKDLATLALSKLESGVPTVAWPEASLYRRDLCGAVAESGLLDALGVDAELEVEPSQRRCETDFDSDGSFKSVTVYTSIGGDLGKDSGARRITVGGHQAVLDQATCELTIDFGANPELAARAGTGAHEALVVSAQVASGTDCQPLVDAATSLVEVLG